MARHVVNYKKLRADLLKIEGPAQLENYLRQNIFDEENIVLGLKEQTWESGTSMFHTNARKWLPTMKVLCKRFKEAFREMKWKLPDITATWSKTRESVFYLCEILKTTFPEISVQERDSIISELELTLRREYRKPKQARKIRILWNVFWNRSRKRSRVFSTISDKKKKSS